MKADTNAEWKKRRAAKLRKLSREPRKVESDWMEWRAPPTRRQWLYKVTVCIFIYFLLWGAFRLEHPLANRIETTVRGYLTDSYDFSSAAIWFDRHIGSWPTFLPAFHPDPTAADRPYSLPASGTIISPYAATGQGIWLATKPGQNVTAIGTGLVVSVSQNPDTGLTVVVRHAEGVRSIYGWLASASVETNDWLKGGAQIGKVKPDQDGVSGKLYFAIMRQNMFIDPGDVIPLD